MADSTEQGCSRCDELTATIVGLQRELAEMREKLAQVEAQLAAAKKNSGNSSKPPSSDITKPPAKRRKPGKRKRGGQPGHPRHERPPFDESAIDFFVRTGRMPECPCCQGPLVDCGPDDKKIHQQVELASKLFTVTQHESQGQRCPHCQKTFYAPWPKELTAAGLVGPQLTALIGYLKGPCHMSISNIRKFFRDVVGFRLSRGQISKLVGKVSEALKDPFEALLDLLPSQNVLNVDETGHKENGKRLWTWCFRAALFTVYRISPSRGSDVLLEVLGKEFNGLLGCDYFSAYRKYMRLNENVMVQFCLAHLIRDLKFLAQHPVPANRDHGKRLVQMMRRMFSIIHRREKYTSEEAFQRALERARNDLVTAATLDSPGTQEASAIEKRFYKHTEEYFRFISEPIDPTNNSAEQMIRFIAIHRRITQGTRSSRGQRWIERMATIYSTCEQQSKSFFLFAVEAVKSLFAELAAPSLLPSLMGELAGNSSEPALTETG